MSELVFKIKWPIPAQFKKKVEWRFIGLTKKVNFLVHKNSLINQFNSDSHSSYDVVTRETNRKKNKEVIKQYVRCEKVTKARIYGKTL